MTITPDDPTPISTGNTNAFLTPVLEGWVGAALAEMAPEAGIVWSVGFQTFPDPSEEDSSAWVPTVVLYLELPTELPDARVYSTHFLPPYALTRGLVNATVYELILQMRNRRRQLMKEAKREGEAEPESPAVQDVPLPEADHSTAV